jgi:hypothetical protein
MSFCLFERRTPGVKPVPSQQEAMRPWVFRQPRLDHAGLMSWSFSMTGSHSR